MSDESSFVDYYGALQLAQNADAEMIERVYRHLAKRYHPDNSDSGDEERFRAVHEAYRVLADPERRAAYDVRFDQQKALGWRIFRSGEALDDREQDQRIFRGLLSLLYAARRQNPRAGGLGTIRIEEMLGIPREHLEFPVWYLRKKGLIETLQSGELAITVAGIDAMDEDRLSPPDNRLLEASPVADASSPPGDLAATG